MLTMKKKILITGGNGTVGAGLVKELRLRGHWVVSCDRSHREDETGFSLRTDVDRPTYARCDLAALAPWSSCPGRHHLARNVA